MTRNRSGATFASLISRFQSSPQFGERSEGTRLLWGPLLEIVKSGLGDLEIEQIVPNVLGDFIDEFDDHPGKQRNMLTALRQLEKWATRRAGVTHHMTTGLDFAKLNGKGRVPWTMEQVLHAERYAREDLARAIVLQALTGQRGSDLVRMRWTDISTDENGQRWIDVRQKKTGVKLGCFILPELEERLAVWPKQPGPILRDLEDKPFTRHSLSMYWVRERRKNRELECLKGLHLHGLRGHYCVRLYRGGMTTRDVSQTVGMSLEMVERYCRLSDQKKNVSAAILRFKDYQPINPLKSLDAPISRK